LLVAIVLGVLGIGFLIVLLQHSRDQAHRIECEMHLKAMGDAVHAFSDDRKTLPASCIAPGYATWAVQIAPFLKQDHGKTLRSWNLQLPYYSQTDAVRQSQVLVYYCPARRDPVWLSTSGDGRDPGGANIPGALGDYACTPASADPQQTRWMTPDANGALIVGQVIEQDSERIVKWRSRTRFDDLKRGLAYTILIGEKHVLLDGFGQASLGDGSLYNSASPANIARLIDADRPLAQGPADAYRVNFGSWHNGICQFLVADDSVRSFSVVTTPRVIQDLIPRQTPE
jgi:hypothetical protein